MTQSRHSRYMRALLFGLATLALPSLSLASDNRSPLAFTSPGTEISFGLQPASATRRFTYGDFSESRGQRAVRTFGLSMRGIPGELGQLLSFPLREPGTTAVFLLGTAALISIDRQTTAFWQDRIEPAFDGIKLPPLFPNLPLMSAETQYMFAGIGLTYAGGLIFNDERAQTAALLSTKAIGYSYLTTQLILKPIFGRLRPVDGLTGFTGDPGEFTTDPWQFHHRDGIPWDGGAYGTAMPSFHFTQYFAMARIYSGLYDNYTWPYLAAGLISVANIRGHNHWVSDMVAGAVIGTGIGNLILNNYQDRKTDQDATMLIPVVTSASVGFAFSMDF